MNKVTVSLAERSYDVLIGAGLLRDAKQLCSPVVGCTKSYVVADQNVSTTHATVVIDALGAENSIEIEANEKNKSLATMQQVWDDMLQSGCDRESVLFAIGGGVIGDMGGFAAATFLRGIRLVQVPTSLLAMVDASVGGKTGVNLSLSANDGLLKNMVGSFWQPSLVISDVETLQTLDNRQLRCGLAECIKHSMLGYEDLSTFILENINAILECDVDACIELVTKSVAIKSEIVSQDECEAGCRTWLNLGHTFAHVLEPIPELSLYHGEAVAIGICAAASCAEAMGIAEGGYVDYVRQVVEAVGLPTRMSVPIDVETLCTRMQTDKKTLGSNLRLVLPSGTSVTVEHEVDIGALNLAWASVGAAV